MDGTAEFLRTSTKKETITMTVLTRFEPFREFSTLQDRINRVFREAYTPAGEDESLDRKSVV